VRMDEFASLKKFRDSILSALSDCVAVIRWVSFVPFPVNLSIPCTFQVKCNPIAREFRMSMCPDVRSKCELYPVRSMSFVTVSSHFSHIQGLILLWYAHEPIPLYSVTC
jgi:hypothetical protein